MAGYIIHIAIAQEYLKKHNIQYNLDFIKGSIMPDFTNDKSSTHYGKSPAYTNLKAFLENNELNNEFKKGEFLHLITDYLFYNYYLESFNKHDLHNDYDILNNEIINKYNVIIIEEIKEKIFFKDGETKVINVQMIYNIIDEISNIDIFDVKEEVLSNDSRWEHYNNLV